MLFTTIAWKSDPWVLWNLSQYHLFFLLYYISVNYSRRNEGHVVSWVYQEHNWTTCSLKFLLLSSLFIQFLYPLHSITHQFYILHHTRLESLLLCANCAKICLKVNVKFSLKVVMSYITFPVFGLTFQHFLLQNQRVQNV